MSDFWKYLIAVLVGLVIGLLINIPSCSNEPTEPKIEYIEKHDTVTITKDRIVPKTKTDYILLVDTFFVTVKDTVYLVDLPVQYQTYKDTIVNDSSSTELDIKYHGFHAGIDSVNVITNYYNTKEYIQEKKKKVYWTWCLGPYAGFGGNVNVTSDKQIGAGFSAGLCFSIGIGGPLNSK